ncbi:MAG: hypothetical protein WD768_11590 [Phycisphaeraceae bacterium]
MMRSASNPVTTSTKSAVSCALVEGPAAPGWIMPWLHRDESRKPASRISHDVELTVADAWTFAQVRMRDVAHASRPQFEAAVSAAYAQLAAALRQGRHQQPVRFWNYVPRLLDPADDADANRNRYMVFNAARHQALEQWFATADIQPRLVAASAVDAHSDDLVVHVLAGGERPQAIENPRQRPAYRYSPTYGPIPPSFARGSLIIGDAAFGSPMLLTAGTASVVGEETRHDNDLPGQLHETELNLTALVAAAMPPGGATSDAMKRFKHIRAYFSRPDDRHILQAKLPDMFPHASAIELMPAVLCRPGLVVEIEGIADLGAVQP